MAPRRMVARRSIFAAGRNRPIARRRARLQTNASLSAKPSGSCTHRTRRPGKPPDPPAIRSVGLTKAMAILRTLSRMVKDAPAGIRIGNRFLRMFDARHEYLMMYNLLLSKAGLSVVGAPQSSDPKPPVQNGTQPKAPEPVATRRKSTDRTRVGVARSSVRVRSPKPGSVFKGSERKPRRSRSRSRAKASFPADSLVGKKAREGRLAAWLAGADEKGSLRGKCKNRHCGIGRPRPASPGPYVSRPG